MKALGRRRSNTNKGFDLVREAQQKQNELDIFREHRKQIEFEIVRKQQEQNESKEQGAIYLSSRGLMLMSIN
uniref:Uncharacterized protein n=1 Tax=Physcomitrium patens TaxID=3218 RepID=A0A2K1JGL2_PHYPA|nr:hypothetical protein PHYPA_018108 [Physcomitrium patens]